MTTFPLSLTNFNADGAHRMPAEWERHAACAILYPHRAGSTWNLRRAQEQVLAVAHAICAGEETVWLYVNNDDAAKALQSELNDNIKVLVLPSNDTWMRDTGPTMVTKDQEMVAVDWEFNAYGGPELGAYWPCDLDQAVAAGVAATASCRAVSIPLVVEGGAIHSDGQGTILTTAECLLLRNKHSREQIEQTILQATGGSTMIWLPTGLAFDDDTNGHVDNWCAFCAPRQVVLSWTDDDVHDAENYARCRESLAVLQQSVDAQGQSLEITKLYLPSPPLVYTADDIASFAGTETTASSGDKDYHRVPGQRLAASYCNFYIANTAVIVPQFGVDTDARAIDTLQALFPTRTVVGVYTKDVLMGGGNIHCITQQIPQV
jgi:agmatine deiminase